MKQLLLLFLLSLSLSALAQRYGGATTNTVGGGGPPAELPYSCTETIGRQQHAAGGGYLPAPAGSEPTPLGPEPTAPGPEPTRRDQLVGAPAP